ncbi:FemAB family XrtA/PEP-CTERM system-associated protein [Sphingobium sp.]|uniref:FemAB family XrtA/PEP-CTERM system-associated protein n=1 Tax=Sphingobium sp. TaxID=1912891 RepID=UPI0039C9E855
MPVSDFGIGGSTSIAIVTATDGPALAEIEAFVAGRTDATPFHRPAWVCAVARGTGQEALFLVARGVGGDIRGLLPVNIIHSPIFGRALVSSGFAVDGGIVADEPAVVRQLADAVVALADRWSCDTIELRGGLASGSDWTVRSGAYLNFTRPLAADDEAELLAIPRKHRAEVRKALEHDYTVIVGTDEAMRLAHYALYRRSVHNLGTPVFPRGLFDQVLDAFGTEIDILQIAHEGTVLSSVIALYHRGACMPYWQGADLNARKARSNEALYFNLMRRARERGCHTFDFGRSKVGTGTAAYKKNWGFEAEPLDYFVHAAPGHAARDINPMSPQYQRKVELWKKLPAALVDRIGPWIARGLG